MSVVPRLLRDRWMAGEPWPQRSAPPGLSSGTARRLVRPGGLLHFWARVLPPLHGAAGLGSRGGAQALVRNAWAAWVTGGTGLGTEEAVAEVGCGRRPLRVCPVALQQGLPVGA